MDKPRLSARRIPARLQLHAILSADIPGFNAMLHRIINFEQQALDLSHYQQLPDNWYIAVADVVGSTQLASAGRDKDVNFIAGAAVAVLTPALTSNDELAAVQFGGDGILAAVPGDKAEQVRTLLAALAYWAKEVFSIELRIGMVPVKSLNQSGLKTYASLQMVSDKHAFGLFLGEGIQAADDWVKQDSQWHIPPAQGALPGLENLSCRWHPIPSHRGCILSIIIDPLPPGDEGIRALDSLFRELNRIAPGELSSPLGKLEQLTPPAIPAWRSVSRELKNPNIGSPLKRLLRVYLGSFILWLAWRIGGKLGPVDAKRYLNSLHNRSDFRKQAGGPRMVLDLTPDEVTATLKLLDAAEARGEILYGTASSEASTLTCLVGDFQANDHIHFVDGQALGFWRASVVLKEKRLARAEKV
ncbi:DUF3095 family protein [Nitrincola iocasae]|uniref:DUF3095 domain-containing protein n=1 Tax=Nitrincola iocasae TaxID=2614693 RepID=A0A5J6LEK8_9GAMM|nr:DUF3095 family protein [Nitrincola iocasae]QEW06813.1 DUF3095 domain-containing protein [Nitrincola iocasae]